MAYKQIRRRTQPELGQPEGASPEINHTPEVSHLQTDRDLITADDALALQDVVGNRATGQLIGATSLATQPRTGYLQPKAIPPQPQRPGGSPHEPVYAHLKRKPALQRASWDGSFDTNADFESQVNQQSGGGKPLPSDVRADLEPKFGADFSGVKVHADAKAAQLSQDVGAQAFTHGSDIYFNQGKYNPESSSGKHLLAHELTHTVQQGAASIQKTSIVQQNAQRNNEQHGPGCSCGSCGRVQRHDDEEMQMKPLLAQPSDEQHGPGCSCGSCGRVQRQVNLQRKTVGMSSQQLLQRCKNCGSANKEDLLQTKLESNRVSVAQMPAVVQRRKGGVIQRHSSWEHKSLGDADPDNLAKIGTWQDLIEQTKEEVKQKRTWLPDIKGPKQEEGKVTIEGVGEVTKGNVMHILAQELNRLDTWQTNPPTQGTTGTIDQTYQTVLVEIPGGGKDKDKPLIVTYGELNTLADYYGNIEAMYEADSTIRWRIVQSVRKETFLRLRDIYTQLEKSLTETEKKDQNVINAKNTLEENKINKDWSNQFMFEDSIQQDYISSVVGQVNLLKKSGTGAKENTDNYAATLARNACHFVPESWHAWSSYHQKARNKAKEAWGYKEDIEFARQSKLLTSLFEDDMVEMEDQDGGESQEIIELQQKANQAANEAILLNGFGDHYLQDSYAAGHMINKTLIMKWFVEWLDNNSDKMDFSTAENWRKVQAIAYNQPEFAKAISGDQDQYKKSDVEGYSSDKTQNNAQNPQAVEDIEGDWLIRFKALGLQVPSSLQNPNSDTRKLLEEWQDLAGRRGFKTLTGAQLLEVKKRLNLADLKSVINRLLNDGIIYLGNYSAKQGQTLLKDKKGLQSAESEAFKLAQFSLREGYVPKNMEKFTKAQDESKEGNDTAYQRMAAMVTYQDYFEFMNSGYLQKSTNALHNKFCLDGLTVTSGDGSLTGAKVYGDDAMFNSNSSAGVKHSAQTAHMSRDAIRNIIDTGSDGGETTAKILNRLPDKVDGIDIATWHNHANSGTLQKYCNDTVFPDMGVTDKAVGAMGDLTPYLSKDQVHAGEAF